MDSSEVCHYIRSEVFWTQFLLNSKKTKSIISEQKTSLSYHL
jgi:hypothetical protein